MQIISRLTLLTASFALGASLCHGADAQENWDKNCASCHAKDGSGNTKMGKKVDAKDYRDPKVQESLQDDKAMKIIKEGINDKGKERMKAYGDKLTDDEIKALIVHIRGFKKS